MNTYTIKPVGYPFTVTVTEEQLKEYSHEVATSICSLRDSLDEVQAFYDEAVTIGEFWTWDSWEGLDLFTPYKGDVITKNGVEETIENYISKLELTVEEMTETALGLAIFEAITKS